MFRYVGGDDPDESAGLLTSAVLSAISKAGIEFQQQPTKKDATPETIHEITSKKPAKKK